MDALPIFESPGLLWLLLLVPAAWFLPRPVRDVPHGLLRSLLIAALVLAIARPVVVSERADPVHVLVIDRSASVGDEARAAADAALPRLVDGLPDTARIVLLTMGDEGPALPEAVGERLAERRRLDGEAGADDLVDALRIAARAIPEGVPGAITLASDGLATRTDWARTTQELTARGIPVHVAPLAGGGGGPRPVGLVALEPLRVGQTGRVAATVAGGPGVCDLVLRAGDRVLARRDGLRLEDRRTVVLEVEPRAAGFLPVTLETGGEAPWQRLTDVLAVQDPLRVLHLGARTAGAGAGLGRLAGRGFEIDATEDPEGAVPDPAAYDLVVLDDRPARTVPEAFQERLRAAVVDGGTGLFMTGGAGSFGPGGWHETPVEELLPVEFVQKEEKKDPSTALAVIIDTSGSMGGQRIVLAKEVTRLALRRLLPHDKVGIVEFYGNKRWAAPLQSAANAINIQRALNRLDAGGGTVILPAIEEAYYGLKNVQTRYKHVLILTDAGVETGAFEPLLRRMAKDGICISTVLVGPGRHSEFLVQLADWGNGRYYNASDRFNLPEVILKQPSTARLPAWRPGPHAVRARGGAGWFGDVDVASLPPLGGYVETRSRPGAEVLVETVSEKHPVLATWHYGMGRVTTFATEPAGAGTEPWAAWSGYPPLLARILMRTADDGRMPFRFDLRREGPALRVVAIRRRPGPGVPTARLLLPEREPASLAFREYAPGRFEAEAIVAPADEVRLEAGVAGTAGPLRWRLASRAGADRSPERNVDPARALDLGALAAATGGTTVPSGGLAEFVPTAGRGRRPRELRDLAPWLLAIALLAFIADLAWRRSRFARPVD